jgi:hypothetical protein
MLRHEITGLWRSDHIILHIFMFFSVVCRYVHAYALTLRELDGFHLLTQHFSRKLEEMILNHKCCYSFFTLHECL